MQTLQQLREGKYQGATSLKLSERLTEFPREIFELAATLEILDLSRNQLNSLPGDLGRLKRLKILFCSENLFTKLPEVLADLPSLDIVGFKSNLISEIPARALNPNIRWLILTNNRIEEIPAEIGNCHRMQKLMLAGNRLTSLPEELSRCRNLSLLRIAANRLTGLPVWLLDMPKLSWLAFSGNLFNIKPQAEAIGFISWDALQIDKQLGEGASGIISKAKMGDDEIAVKIFKGAVTSDGLPEDEMHAYIVAGAHPGLVQLRGQIAGHPEDKKGLVMELIPQRFFNLGITPSFESCTRDVFDKDLKISAGQALKIAGTIASLVAHLHSKGIMHADLYAHNTLIDDEGNTLFGDFGAACFYDRQDTRMAQALERLEVSAFGHLLDDLICLCTDPGHAALKRLRELSDICVDPEVAARPDFSWLDSEIALLS
ncbi:protein kinase [Mucilaginibacter sp. PPCGB 2223]|uniref:leucine-rich repeat-containing protein kinase family protein n=1 Tax=Mucilaginibacter sp. PPCGB 2223 TaxID=1886027 RepID=UPI0008242C3D|nr:leucine-rich repeat-containing protein kinase family protein [Mucilaginibacter sp. PPCGB 2223]OCX52149.1 protein kinase [Mucilaginibacter sp. PPCGB 2223]